MPGVDALVAEIAVDFKDLLKAAHKQALQVELWRYAHVEVYVQRIVLGNKGLGCRTARDGVHHGRFHFHEAVLFQQVAHLADYDAALFEDFPGARIDNEVHVALAVPGLGVREPVVLFGQGAHGAGDELDGAAGNGELVCLGAEEMARYADDVAHVELLHDGKAVA